MIPVIALLSLLGIIFGAILKNRAVVMLGILGFLYFLGLFATLPIYVWIIIIIIFARWVIKWK